MSEIIIPITNEMITIAENAEDIILKKLADQNKKQYTGISHERSFFIGMLGELAFYEYCKRKQIYFNYTVDTSGEAKDNDFIMVNEGSKKTIEVKTRSEPIHDMIMIPWNQFKLYTSDYYIGVKLLYPPNTKTFDIAEIHGWCLKSDFKETWATYKLPGNPMCKPFNELKSIDELFKTFKTGTPILNIDQKLYIKKPLT